MRAHSQVRRRNRAKVTIGCTTGEKAYIKMLAAQAHMSLGELIISYLRKDFLTPKSKEPNAETLASMKELDEGGGTEYTSMDDFWADMGVRPSAKS